MSLISDPLNKLLEEDVKLWWDVCHWKCIRNGNTWFAKVL